MHPALLSWFLMGQGPHIWVHQATVVHEWGKHSDASQQCSQLSIYTKDYGLVHCCSSFLRSDTIPALCVKRVRHVPALFFVPWEGWPASWANEAKDRQQLTDAAEVGSEESKRTTQRQKWRDTDLQPMGLSINLLLLRCDGHQRS